MKINIKSALQTLTCISVAMACTYLVVTIYVPSMPLVNLDYPAPGDD